MREIGANLVVTPTRKVQTTATEGRKPVMWNGARFAVLRYSKISMDR